MAFKTNYADDSDFSDEIEDGSFVEWNKFMEQNTLIFHKDPTKFLRKYYLLNYDHFKQDRLKFNGFLHKIAFLVRARKVLHIPHDFFDEH